MGRGEDMLGIWGEGRRDMGRGEEGWGEGRRDGKKERSK